MTDTDVTARPATTAYHPHWCERKRCEVWEMERRGPTGNHVRRVATFRSPLNFDDTTFNIDIVFDHDPYADSKVRLRLQLDRRDAEEVQYAYLTGPEALVVSEVLQDSVESLTMWQRDGTMEP